MEPHGFIKKKIEDESSATSLFSKAVLPSGAGFRELVSRSKGGRRGRRRPKRQWSHPETHLDTRCKLHHKFENKTKTTHLDVVCTKLTWSLLRRSLSGPLSWQTPPLDDPMGPPQTDPGGHFLTPLRGPKSAPQNERGTLNLKQAFF